MKIVLTQPNYAWQSKRTWKMPPYTLALLNACLKDEFEVELFDPNYTNMSEEEVLEYFKKTRPDIVGVSSNSTEYIKNARLMTSVIKKALPDSIVIQGGTIPTVALDIAMKDPNVNYWIMGEGEYRLPRLLRELEKPHPDLSSIDGLAYREDGVPSITEPEGFIQDLDSIPFPDYGNLNLLDYGNVLLKYSGGLSSRNVPYAFTVTSRGCPYKCVFCAASTVSGRKIRFRSAANVLREVDMLYESGIREIIFLDDHFLGNRKRAEAIMRGLIDRKYDLRWKCLNLTIFLLDREFLELMKESGCYQMTLSIESGSQYMLDNVIRKPVKLSRVQGVLDIASSLGLETIANFVIGFPGETWEQIRETFKFAESINIDLVNFHIATPLPKTELMETCIRDGYLPEGYNLEGDAQSGYAKGIISTSEFTASELEILRAFEWDRINFSTPERRQRIARIEGITLEELEEWRKNTRRKWGVNVLV